MDGVGNVICVSVPYQATSHQYRSAFNWHQLNEWIERYITNGQMDALMDVWIYNTDIALGLSTDGLLGLLLCGGMER